VGNAVLPLLEANEAATAYACDFSATAVGILRAHALHAAGRLHAFVADLTTEDLAAHGVPRAGVDFCTLIFVLSAIDPARMPQACRTAFPSPLAVECMHATLPLSSIHACMRVVCPAARRWSETWHCPPSKLHKACTVRCHPACKWRVRRPAGGQEPGARVQAGRRPRAGARLRGG
jgi:hypothetical protein